MTAHSQLHEPQVARGRHDPVRKLLRRMGDRTRQQSWRQGLREGRVRHEQLHFRMHKRKAALAFSAGVMGLSSAAMASPALPGETAANVQTANPLVRLPASTLHASASFKQALVQEEGVQTTVYRDVAGYPTVGVGHLVTSADGLSVGDKVSYDKILEFLDDDLNEAEAAVVRLVGDLPLYQHEFDALVDLVYNVGEGTLSPRKSPRLNRAIAARDYDAMAAELDYRFAAGQMARGLAYRSERRARIFMNASYEDTRPARTFALR